MINEDVSAIPGIIERLRKTFQAGKTRSLQFRKQQLKNLLKGLATLEKETEDALKKDLNYSPFMTLFLSTSTTKIEIENNLQNLEKWAKPRSADTSLLVGPAKSYVVPEPLGVVLVLGAWNVPLYTSIAPVASAIAAGNCVVLKPSEMSPQTSNIMAKLFREYMDPDCYTVVEGGGNTATTLTKSIFDLIIFTGSSEKGKLVAKAAAENLIPCILELGGKSPTIVDDGANLENAALRITQGRFSNSGQLCVAPDYVFVHKNIKEEFVLRVKQKINEFYGTDLNNNPDWVKIINENHTKRLKGLIEENHGGKIILGGKVQIEQRIVEPTIIDSPSPNSKVMNEEIFGPILPINTFENLDEVISFINKREKPLSLYYFGPVFSKNKERILRETSSGALSINETCFHALNAQLPFGGVGNSGMKYLHGQWGFDSCSHLKSVLDKLPYMNGGLIAARYPPHTPQRQKIFRLLSKSIDLYQGSLLKVLLWFAIIVFFVCLIRCSCLKNTFSKWKEQL